MSISFINRIEDPGIREAFETISKEVDKSNNANYEIVPKEITKADLNKLVPGKRYIDEKNKRVVIKIGGKLYYSQLTEL